MQTFGHSIVHIVVILASFRFIKKTLSTFFSVLMTSIIWMLFKVDLSDFVLHRLNFFINLGEQTWALPYVLHSVHKVTEPGKYVTCKYIF